MKLRVVEYQSKQFLLSLECILKVESPGSLTEFLIQDMWGNSWGFFKAFCYVWNMAIKAQSVIEFWNFL